MDVEKSYEKLRRLTGAVVGYAKGLAVSLGNFHGLNEFSLKNRIEVVNGFILPDLSRDMTAMVVLRTSALIDPGVNRGDATLVAAYNIAKDVRLRSRILAAARLWNPGDAQLAASNEKAALRELDQFLALVPQIDGRRLKKHRDSMLAHSTLKTPPGILYREVWAAADTTLQAVDCLSRFALGRQENLRDRSVDRRQQAVEFWDSLIPQAEEAAA